MSEAYPPHNWTITTLGSFIDFKNGVNADKEAYGKGIKFVNIMDIFKKNYLFCKDITGSVQITDKQKKDFSVIKGDILFNRTSEIPDEIAFASVYLDDKEIVFGGFVIRGRQYKLLLVPEYTKYCFKHQSIRKEMIRRCQGVVRGNIGQKDLSKISITIPPFKEQQVIAKTLDLWGMAIEKIEALIAAKQKQFDWLISKLVSNPPHNKGWKKVSLQDIGDISSAGVDKKIVKDEDDVVLLNYLDVYRRNMIFANELNHKVTAPKSKIEKCSIKRGDIFFTPSSEVRGDIGLSAVVMEDAPNGVYSYHIVRLRPRIKIDTLYSAYAFKGHNFYKQAAMYADGSGQRYVVSQNCFRKIELLLPPVLEQRSIGNTLHTAQQEIDQLKKLADLYRTQKRGLMQKLLSGEWRFQNKNKEAA